MLGMKEVKRFIFTHCPICKEQKSRREIAHNDWTTICTGCRFSVGFFDFEPRFMVGYHWFDSSYSEEEFERYLKLRSFE